MTYGTPDLVRGIWKRLRRQKRSIAIALVLLLISVPLVNFHPAVWGFVADALMDETLNGTTLALAVGVMVLTYVLGSACGALQSYLLEKAGQAFVRDIRVEVFAKLLRQNLSYHDHSSSGELVTRITSDVDAMEQSVLRGLVSLAEEVVTFIVVATMVLVISPVVGALSILPLSLSFIFIRIFNRRVKRAYDKARRQVGRIGSFVQGRLGGIEVIQGFGRERAEIDSFSERSGQFYEASVRASRTRNSFFPVVGFFGFVNNAVMLGAGAWLIMEGSPLFTIGGLIAYRGFWWRLQSPIRTIAQTSDILQRARASAERVFSILDAPVAIEDRPGAVAQAPSAGRVGFEDVSFAYDGGDFILKEVSFAVEPGELVAIAGSSGSGKSTLLRLIPRFYDCLSGSVRVDGRDVREFRLDDLRAPMGLVPQDSYLFDASVLENIRYGYPEASDTAVREAARAANAHGFIDRLPKGEMTLVGENGARLSGGQRQRISLARALLSRARILLLDEPTASVEPESESAIHDALLNLSGRQQVTTIVATHRIDFLRVVPRILFLAEGRLQGDGPHEELLQTCPAYRRAYQRWQSEERALSRPNAASLTNT